jgi:hypothetical protein
MSSRALIGLMDDAEESHVGEDESEGHTRECDR